MSGPQQSLASAFHRCRQKFESILGLLDSSNKDEAISVLLWEDEASRFRLWGANIGAAQSKANTSLDFRLRDADTVRQQIYKNLDDLGDALQEAFDSMDGLANGAESKQSGSLSDHITTVSLPDTGEADNTDDAEASEYEEDLRAAYEDVVSLINLLFRMTLYIRNPSRRDQLKHRDTSAVATFEAFDVSHVENKFPTADNSLTRRLGQANTVRRANLRYWERHHKKLAVDETEDDRATVVAPLSESVATEFKQIEETEYHDTRSHFSGTSYMESMLGGDSIRRPDLPKEGKDGAPFQCPICCYIVTVSGQREWMKHVFFDLQPYVCVFMDCKTPLLLYENRRDWFAHVSSNHLSMGESGPFQRVECQLCHETVRSLPVIRRHLARHLEEVALFSLPNSLFGEETEIVDDDKPEEDCSSREEPMEDDYSGEEPVEDASVHISDSELADGIAESARPSMIHDPNKLNATERIRGLAIEYKNRLLPKALKFCRNPSLDLTKRKNTHWAISQAIMVLILKLDSIETPLAPGSILRQRRKSLVARMNQMLRRMDKVNETGEADPEIEALESLHFEDEIVTDETDRTKADEPPAKYTTRSEMGGGVTQDTVATSGLQAYLVHQNAAATSNKEKGANAGEEDGGDSTPSEGVEAASDSDAESFKFRGRSVEFDIKNRDWEPRESADEALEEKTTNAIKAADAAQQQPRKSLNLNSPEGESSEHELGSAESAGDDRKSSTRQIAAGATLPGSARHQRFVHPKGACMTCDRYGYHVEIRLSRGQELFIMREFASHASHCSICADPLKVVQTGGELCESGQKHAQNLAHYIYSEDGRPHSVIDRYSKGQEAEIDIPAECEVIRDLIKAVDKGLNLRSRKPTVIEERGPIVSDRRAGERGRRRRYNSPDYGAGLTQISPPRRQHTRYVLDDPELDDRTYDYVQGESRSRGLYELDEAGERRMRDLFELDEAVNSRTPLDEVSEAASQGRQRDEDDPSRESALSHRTRKPYPDRTRIDLSNAGLPPEIPPCRPTVAMPKKDRFIPLLDENEPKKEKWKDRGDDDDIVRVDQVADDGLDDSI